VPPCFLVWGCLVMAEVREEVDEVERALQQQYDVLGRQEVLGEGTFGKVYKGMCRRTDVVVALKEMKCLGNDEGVPSTAIREIALLKELHHENIVRLMDVFCKPAKLILVFEFVESDLKKYMRARGCQLSPDRIKDFLSQLLTGLEFCHSHRIIHRDLKPPNLLIDSNQRLKLADFGLARAFTLPVPKYTHEVVTVWYRPPEILLGSAVYSVPVDIWSVGCILGEMASGAPLFAGDSEIDTAFKIFQKLGTPTEATWPGVSDLPDFKPTFPMWQAKGWKNIRNTAEQLGAEGIDLLENFMRYAPKDRISARRALQHPYLVGHDQ